MKLITWNKVYCRWGEWIWCARCQCTIPACPEMSIDVGDVQVREYSALPTRGSVFNWVESWSVVKWIHIWLGSPGLSHDGVWHSATFGAPLSMRTWTNHSMVARECCTLSSTHWRCSSCPHWMSQITSAISHKALTEAWVSCWGGDKQETQDEATTGKEGTQDKEATAPDMLLVSLEPALELTIHSHFTLSSWQATQVVWWWLLPPHCRH